MPASTQLTPRLAIVTGAASGLGRAFCRQLAADGAWHIVAVDLDDVGAAASVAEVARLGASTGEVAHMDVSDAAAWIALRDRLERAWPRLDLLVNNAGICLSAEVGEGPLDNWRRVTEVNYHGVLAGCHVMTPWLKRSAEQAASGLGPQASDFRPAIINIASIFAVLPIPTMAAYNASKAAVLALSETLAVELRPHGVRVTVVTPGFFPTQLIARGAFHVPSRRVRAEEITRAATFTADDVAKAALAASRRGRLHVTLGRRARWMWRWKRMAPLSLMHALSRRYRQSIEGEA